MMTYQYPFRGKYAFGTAYGVKGSMWKIGWHSGLDFRSLSYGGDGKVYPVCDGKVQRVMLNDKSYGNYVQVLHSDGYLSLYAHLSKVTVTTGQTVTRDTQLGVEGTTGNSTGVHLHIEIYKGAYSYPSSIDPRKFIDGKLKEQEESAMANTTATPQPSAWAKAAWEKATKAGITDGTNPQGAITREQVIVMLDRVGLLK